MGYTVQARLTTAWGPSQTLLPPYDEDEWKVTGRLRPQHGSGYQTSPQKRAFDRSSTADRST
jgi:hypothetical protein